jgi:hypothetical protein
MREERSRSIASTASNPMAFRTGLAIAHRLAAANGVRARLTRVPGVRYRRARTARAHHLRGHDPRGRGRKTARAADPRPRQAGRPVRRAVSADRLRAVELRQLRDQQDLGADAVQGRVAHAAPRARLAARAAARPLRRAGAGDDEPRPALVPGQRRRGLPEPGRDRERVARLRLRLRRRPHLQDGRRQMLQLHRDSAPRRRSR